MTTENFSPLMLGTCRTHDPVKFLREKGCVAYITNERYHSPQQLLKIVKFLSKTIEIPKTELHTLSDFTIEQIVAGQSLDSIYEQLLNQRSFWEKATHLVIEISTRKEFYYTQKDKQIFVNTFTKRDLTQYQSELQTFYDKGLLKPLYADDIQETNSSETRIHSIMSQIKSLGKDKKILWVSHISPSDKQPNLEYLISQRNLLANQQESLANKLGDKFFNPTVVAGKLGDNLFFKDNGQDINHMTAAGAQELANYYFDILKDY